jgi:MFS family permease
VLEAVVGLGPTYWSVVVLLLPMGAATLTFTISANSTVQLGSDAAFRGRVMALYLMCFMGGTPLGAPLVGVASDAFGPRAGVVGSGVICAVAAVVAAGWVARRRGVSLSTQVGESMPHPHLPHPHLAMPHPHLRLHKPVEPVVPAASAQPPVPAGTATPAESAVDAHLVESAVTERRRAG